MSNAGRGLRLPGETPCRFSKKPEDGHHLHANQHVRRHRGPHPAASVPGEHAVIEATGVPLQAAAFGAHTATRVNAGWLALGVALGTFWGTVLPVVFARRAARPARALPATTLPLLALSLTGPLTAHATAATSVHSSLKERAGVKRG